MRNLLSGKSWDCVVDWVGYEECDIIRNVELFRGRTRQFVFISSTSAYQKPLPSPWVTEATPIGNRYWAYADRKAQCERALHKFTREEGFPVTIVRPGAVYAEFTLPTGIAGWGYGAVRRMRDDKPVLVHGDGTGWWTLTFNEDFARAFVPLLGMEKAVGGDLPDRLWGNPFLGATLRSDRRNLWCDSVLRLCIGACDQAA